MTIMNKNVINKQLLPRKIIPFVWFLIKGFRWGIALSFLSISVWSIANGFVFPYLTKDLISVLEEYTGNQNLFIEKAGILFIYLVLTLVVAETFMWIGVFARTWFIPGLRARANNVLFSYLQNHSFTYFANKMSGKLSQKISDISGSVAPLTQIITHSLIPTSLIVLTNLVMFFHISPIAGGILFGWVFIHIGTVILATPYWNRKGKASAESKSNVTGHIVDSITNFTIVKLFANKIFESKLLSKKVKTMKGKQREAWMANNKVVFPLAINYVLFYSSFLFGLGYLFMNHRISLGEIIYMIIAMESILSNVWQITWELPALTEHVSTISKAVETITEPQTVQDIPTSKNLNLKNGNIKINQLHFKYENEWIFKNLSLEIKSGEKVGLVGLSGAGKSTLVHLILRLYDINKGNIKIDEQDISKVNQDSLRSKISMVTQDNSLFHRTLIENIKYGKPKATKKEVEKASRLAHAHKFIQSLEKGYQSKVGERGIKLSGGQRQRVAIARAFLKNAPILILDEATSALDTETEKVIQESLTKLMKKRTTIAIAHRLSTLLEMDKIVVLDKGKIIEIGSHKKLLSKKNGLYAKLWKMQSGGFLPE